MDKGPHTSVSLRVSVLDRCQLRCLYCVPAHSAPKLPRREMLSFEEIVRLARMVRARFGLAKVRLTGGEPLLRPRLSQLIAEVCTLLQPSDFPELVSTPLPNPARIAGTSRTEATRDSANQWSVRRSICSGENWATCTS